jgi:molecular chaperone GrpE
MEKTEKSTQSEELENVNDEVVEEQQDQTAEETELTPEQQQIANLEAKVSELNTRLMRNQADLENFRRRARQEQETAAKYRAQSLIEDILPAIDNFSRALAFEPENEQVKSLHQGMEMVYRQLFDALTKEGLTEIDPQGEQFDPHLHQAVMQVESDEHESNIVVEVLQKGFMLKDRVIRPAMVKVNA